jgi:putative ABC transport system permease protein
MMTYTNLKGQTNSFNESNFYLADASFLTMFSFSFLKGDPATALIKPNTAVISSSQAVKYFGTTDPIGKSVSLNKMPLTITGVFQDIPENSHIGFNMLVSLNSVGPKFGYSDWGMPAYYDYVLLAPGTDPKRVEAKFPAFIEKYLGAKIRAMNLPVQFRLQPLTDIHLKSAYGVEAEANSSESALYFLSTLGIFLLMIAWINYINLSTAKSLERAREVGVRKVAGASRLQVAGQFMLESVLINTGALLLSVLIVIIAEPYFDALTGKSVSKAFFASGLLHSWKFWLILSVVFITGALQVGAYPAFILSAFKPALVLKGQFQRSGKSIFLRKALVTFQFFLSILLIAGMLIVYQQLQFMHNQNPGYIKDQLLVVKAPALADSTFFNRVDFFKAELLKNPAIKGMAPTSEIPGQAIEANNGVRRSDQDPQENIYAYFLEIDRDFVPTYQVGLAAGTNLLGTDPGNLYATKRTDVLINEVLAKQLGYRSAEAALHHNISFVSWVGDIAGEIVGVVKNYHQQSLDQPYEPILYYQRNGTRWSYFSINLSTKDLHHNLVYIQRAYGRAFPGNAYENYFLNDHFNRQYQADERLGDFFSLFTLLAIFIACLGLIGLSAFSIKLRTKEISIRKVLGASAHGIVYLFYGDFIKLVCLAAIIAIPVVYWVATKWLNNFAFHIHLGWSVFFASPLLLTVISLATVSLQSLKAALADPINGLRND